MDRLIQRTVDADITWIPCSGRGAFGDKFDLTRNCSELYGAQYDIGRFYIGQGDNDLEFYISLEDGQCLRQNENIVQLQELWKKIKEKEQELQEKIDEYKRNFIDN